jgi:hypothetical protein
MRGSSHDDDADTAKTTNNTANCISHAGALAMATTTTTTTTTSTTTTTTTTQIHAPCRTRVAAAATQRAISVSSGHAAVLLIAGG